MNVRLACRILGALLGLFSLSILITVPFGVYYREAAAFACLEACGIGMLFAGALLFIGRRAHGEMYRREALAIVGLSWVLAAAVGALPFMLSDAIPSFAASYFESMSGLTTTGSSVLADIESVPKCILLWRSFLHYLGGLGIVVLFVAFLPIIGVGGRALFKQEVPGPVAEGMTPRIKDTAIRLWKLYTALNVIEAVLLMMAGMSFYDAINHAMATMATGGFSTKNTSVLAFNSPMIEWIIVVFMFVAGTNFTLHLQALKGKMDFIRNAEFLTYSGIILGSSILIAALLFVSPEAKVSTPGGFNFRDALFAVVSIQTTTGFGTQDFDTWPEAARVLLLILMFVGGCAGSTGGGIKVIRWVILFKAASHQLAQNSSPRRVRTMKLGGRAVGRDVIVGVQIFFFIWLMVVFLGTFLVALLMPEQGFLTSFTAVIATLNNIGPGLDAVGPTMNYAAQSGPVMLLLSLFMVLGRLELYAILALLAPHFWVSD